MIDIGVNLTNPALLKNIETVIGDAKLAGITAMVVTGTNLDESFKAIELCKKWPDYLYSTVGCHPHHADEMSQQDQIQFKKMLSQPCVKAIGECGLDFNRNYSTKKNQIKAFEYQLQLSVETKHPLFLHQRDAHSTFCEILSSYRSSLNKVVVHCFTEGLEQTKDYLDLDCYFGITGWVCDERRNKALIEALKIIPNNRLMIETDAPYLLPRNMLPKPKSRTNQPKYLSWIIDKLSSVKNISTDQLIEWTNTNSLDFFDLSNKQR